MRSHIALFTFTIISAAAFGLFISEPVCAEPATEIQSGLLPASGSYAVVFAARYDGGAGMLRGGTWSGGQSWSGRDGWYRPYRGFDRGGYTEPEYMAPYYGEPNYVVPKCDNAVVDPYSGGWVCLIEPYVP